MQINDTLTVTIEKVVYGGNGLARVDGRVVFVPGSLPGELLAVQITDLKKSYAVAEITEIITPSPDRIAPECRVADTSGEIIRIPGCVYDHASYAAEVAIKQAQLKEFMYGVATYAPPPMQGSEEDMPFPSPKHLHYRNKLTLHTQTTDGISKLGYRMERSHRVIDIPACPLSCSTINEQLDTMRSSPEFGSMPDGTTLTIRHTQADGIRWWLNQPGHREWLTEESAIGPLRVSADGFYQVNPEVGTALTRCAMDWYKLDPTETVLDLYCGIGLFGLACMTCGGERLIGIESGKRAVLAARHNAAARGIPAEFHAVELGRRKFEISHYLKNPGATTCIIDPPRTGMERSLTLILAHSGIPRILYVSCDPATLQRDLKILAREGGYKVKRVQLFDMFPRTAHFETIVEMIAAD